MSVFLQLFCEACGFAILLNDSQQGACANASCRMYGKLLQIKVSIAVIPPVADTYAGMFC